MAITEDRLKEVNFSDPYYYDGAAFFSLKSNGYKSIDDLVDGKVGAVTGTTYVTELSARANIKEVVPFETDQENMLAARDKRIDGLATSRFVGLTAPKEYDLVQVGPLLYTEKIAIAIRKDDDDLLEAINAALAEIVEDGTYEKISQKYFGTNILETGDKE
jgi:polar amino acid transport system substrate-binding protein